MNTVFGRLPTVFSPTLPLLLAIALVLGGCASPPVSPASSAPTSPSAGSTSPAAPPPTSPAGATKLDVGVGAPPPEGWRWVVGEINTGADEVTEAPNPGHGFFWEFFVVKGSNEVSTGDGKKVASAGEGIMVPAKQQHSHRYPPQSKVLVFDVRSANDNPDAFHRGTKLFLSGTLSLRSSSDHKLRVQEFSLSPGQRLPETTTAEPNFFYVMEGILTSGTTATETGKAGSLPLNVKLALSNEGKTPLKFLLVDVRP